MKKFNDIILENNKNILNIQINIDVSDFGDDGAKMTSEISRSIGSALYSAKESNFKKSKINIYGPNTKIVGSLIIK